MADRVVSYEFKGRFTNLTAGLSAAGKSVGDLGSKMTALDKNGAKMRAGLTSIGGAAGKMGLVAAAGLGAIELASANFDKAMSAVQAATHETAGNMELLRKAAIKAGADTVYSASEAAGAIEELSKAGVATKDILAGGLSGALNLAAAGNLEVADAAEIAASALTQFQLSGKDVPHVADLLAAGAGKAQGSVQDLGYALKYAGVPANALGVSIEETTGVLAEFASTGIVGEQAGTTLRSMLLSLSAPTKQASEMMKSYGLNLYDASGKFVGLKEAAAQLQSGLGPLTEAERNHALSVIFGQNAIQGAISLYQGGGKAVADWTHKVNDAGYASETAATRLNNLSGDVEQFKGSLETALIGAGEGSQGILRGVVQDATKVVNAFNGLPPAAQNVTTAFLGITAVTGGGLWFGSKVITGIADTRLALANLGATAKTTKLAMTGVGAGVSFAVVLTGIGLVNKAFNDLRDTVSTTDLERNLEALARGAQVDDFSKLAQNLSDLGSTMTYVNDKFSDALTFGIDTSELENAQQEVEKVDQGLAAMVESGNAEQAAAAYAQIVKQAAAAGVSSADVAKAFNAYQTALANIPPAADDAASSTTQYAGATTNASAAAGAAAQKVDRLAASMTAQHKAALAAFDAETQWRQALKDAAAQAAKNNAGIKGNTDAALQNRASLSSLAAAWNNQSKAVKNNEERFQAAKTQFIQTAVAMGVPRQAAIALAKSILDIPKSHSTNLVAQTDTAFAHIRAIKSELASIDRDVYINMHVRAPSISGMGPQLRPESMDGRTLDGRTLEEVSA